MPNPNTLTIHESLEKTLPGISKHIDTRLGAVSELLDRGHVPEATAAVSKLRAELAKCRWVDNGDGTYSLICL